MAKKKQILVPGAWLHLSVDSASRRDGGCMSCGIDKWRPLAGNEHFNKRHRSAIVILIDDLVVSASITLRAETFLGYAPGRRDD